MPFPILGYFVLSEHWSAVWLDAANRVLNLLNEDKWYFRNVLQEKVAISCVVEEQQNQIVYFVLFITEAVKTTEFKGQIFSYSSLSVII